MELCLIVEPAENRTEWLGALAEASQSQSGAGISTVLVFVLFTAAIKLLLNDKKQKVFIPGPLSLPLIGNGFLLAGGPTKLLKTIPRYLDKYKGIFGIWIGPKLTVFISKPEYLEVFCTHPKLLDKSGEYRFVTPLLGDGLFCANGATWKQGRKLIIPTLKPAILKTMMPTFNKCTNILISNLEKEAGVGQFDILPYLRNCTYDMIFETLLGRECWMQKEKSDVLEDSEEIMDLISKRIWKPWHQWDPLFYLLPTGRRFRQLAQKLNKFNLGTMMESLAMLERGELGVREEGHLLIEHLSRELGRDFKTMREHMTTMLITGYDTTTGTLGFILLMLAIHQDVQDKVLEEVRAIKLKLKDQNWGAEDMEMEYLERVIKETLRLFPVGPFLLRRAAEDVKMGDYTIPKDSTVACVMLRTHRDPASYKNHHKFNPDNFLPENVAKRHPYSYIPFSAGPRGCVGAKYGMMSMKVIIAELIYKYRIFTDITMNDIKLKMEVTMKIEGGFNLQLKKRNT